MRPPNLRFRNAVEQQHGSGIGHDPLSGGSGGYSWDYVRKITQSPATSELFSQQEVSSLRIVCT